ncbi:Conserved membrane protein of uncharacterised function [Mycobacteroides abscessus subsp. bolletii]|uniref:hypothetical protein n=1 Tax=Mycobacteroides abscessus TaxID=36809 RepID=UPI00092C64BA|nr:hypothetical protein [Mycobacteroides abscessus]SHX51348.1 Conserved membrane protein of uncharacterised function [Mycobacteroides abscessus subsp. bolletii]SKP63768.1 Conserved membrane protein of uncharacterised function [Mycobacteroides abscessus subsp. bolletii]SKP72309.1 Conserved membrane protein of uncharacterised function [Mycobacteroides abscessus subsp. bolletii]SKQ24531.1 Conserved membrane protein of uncharacterised function [Mycobacteroides abscessus subsp. bolletii]
MTESDDTQRPVSVAELLARNGAAEGKISGHRRRMRGNADAIPVAELTGEIPVIRDKKGGRARPNPSPAAETAAPEATKAPEAAASSETRSYLRSNEDALFGGDSMADEAARRGPSTPSTPAQPSSMASSLRSIFPPTPTPATRPGEPRKSIDFNDATGVISPVTSAPTSEPTPKPEAAKPATPVPPAPPYAPPATPPAPVSRPVEAEPEPEPEPEPEAEAEAVVQPEAEPEPDARPEVIADEYEDDEYEDYAEYEEDDGDYGRSPAVEWNSHDAEHDVEGEENDYDENDYQLEHELQELVNEHGSSVDTESSQLADVETGKKSDAEAKAERKEKIKTYLQGGWIAAQYLLAAAAGAGLFFGFRELWSWNQGIALVLGVLFIAILVASLWVIRKTVDLISILIAIVVGALIAFGPLVLMLQAVD